MPTPALLRSRVRDLTTLASHDLTVVWRQVKEASDAAEPLHDILPGLITAYGSAAATVAADWYDDLRHQREVKGRFRAIPADLSGNSGANALVGWAVSEARDFPAFTTLVEGGMQRRIANAARETVMGSSIADPRARGWERDSAGNACDFCEMLVGRGAVYSEASADFEAHDHDECFASPAF